MTKQILLLDMNNILCRAWYSKAGKLANGAAYSTLRTIIMLAKTFKHARGLVAVWDNRESLNGSRKIDSTYKKNRARQDSELIAQFNLAREFLRVLAVPQVCMKSCEADCAIAYLAARFGETDRIIIVSQDQDFFQLLSDNVIMYRNDGIFDVDSLSHHKVYGGLSPKQVGLVRCLVGDKTDNVSGVRGYGIVKSRALVTASRSVHEIMCKLNDDESRRRFTKNMQLMLLPTSCRPQDVCKLFDGSIIYPCSFKRDDIIAKLTQVGMHSLVASFDRWEQLLFSFYSNLGGSFHEALYR